VKQPKGVDADNAGHGKHAHQVDDSGPPIGGHSIATVGGNFAHAALGING
jgi:hypothetical protein